MRGMMLGFGLIYFLCGAWGITTGVGILRLRAWARMSMLVLSAVVAVFSVFGALGAIAAPLMMNESSQAPPGAMVIGLVVGLIVVMVPLGFAIWWLILFARRSVRAQFAPGAAAASALAHPAFATAALYPTGSERLSPRMQLSYRRPVSITVIAVWLIAVSAFFPLMLLYPSKWRMTAMFGVILTGKPFLLVSAIFAAANLALGVGLLRLKQWARIGAIAYLVVMLVNSVLSVRVMGKLMDLMHKQMGIPAPPVPAGFLRIITFVGLAFGVGLNLAALYFVVTRGAAFRPPPDASASAGSVAPFDANPAAPQ
jgi:hypothetical protein